MKAPDKIYLHKIRDEESSGFYKMWFEQRAGGVPSEEYIRKDIVDETVKTVEDHAYFAGQEKFREKLIEWIQEVRTIPHENAITRDLAFQEFVNELNSCKTKFRIIKRTHPFHSYTKP